MFVPRGLRLAQRAGAHCRLHGASVARLSSAQAPRPSASPVGFLLKEVGASLRVLLGLGFGIGGTAALYEAYRESSDPPAPGALVDVQPWYVVEPEPESPYAGEGVAVSGHTATAAIKTGETTTTGTHTSAADGARLRGAPVRLHCVVRESDGTGVGVGTGPPVTYVLIGGSAETTLEWSQLQHMLADCGSRGGGDGVTAGSNTKSPDAGVRAKARVIAYDRRGLGFSATAATGQSMVAKLTSSLQSFIPSMSTVDNGDSSVSAPATALRGAAELDALLTAIGVGRDEPLVLVSSGAGSLLATCFEAHYARCLDLDPSLRPDVSSVHDTCDGTEIIDTQSYAPSGWCVAASVHIDPLRPGAREAQCAISDRVRSTIKRMADGSSGSSLELLAALGVLRYVLNSRIGDADSSFRQRYHPTAIRYVPTASATAAHHRGVAEETSALWRSEQEAERAEDILNAAASRSRTLVLRRERADLFAPLTGRSGGGLTKEEVDAMERVWDRAICTFADAAAGGNSGAGKRSGTSAQQNTATISKGGHLMAQDRAEDVADAIRAWLC
eukprot:g753.t1